MVTCDHRYPSDNDWTKTLFLDNPELFLPVLESLKPEGQAEAENLVKIFDEFNVPRNSRVLDLSCGIGRHSINLVKKGYRVVGYDPSDFYLQKAREWAVHDLSDGTKEIRFYQGDAHKASEVLSAHGETGFNAIILMFNSLGYLGEAVDIQTLKGVLSLAAPKCILVTETDNRDWWIRNFQTNQNFEFDELEIHERWELDLENSFANSRSKFYKRNPLDKTLCLLLDLRTSQRLYSLHELISIVSKAGWKYVRSQKGFQSLEPSAIDNLEIVTVSQKE